MKEDMLSAVIVGQVIADFRRHKCVSQEVVSGFADIGRTHLSAIERGDRKPTLETFYKICLAMDLKPIVVFTEIERRIEETKLKKH